MNSKQLKILWVAIILITIMALFPPLIGKISDTGMEKFIGCQFIYRHSVYKKFWGAHYQVTKVDFIRLIVQAVPVILIAGGLICTFRDKKTQIELSQ